MPNQSLAYLAIVVLGAGCLGVSCVQAAVLPGDLIKGSGSTVYYVSRDNKRYVFPNQTTFDSWFGGSGMNKIKAVSDDELAQYALGRTITVKPGSRLVKTAYDTKVYAVSAGGRLHWVRNEDIAVQLYGDSWNQRVIDVPETFFSDYLMDTTITSGDAYDRQEASDAVPDIQVDFDARENYVSDQWLAAGQKKVMHELTNLFENGETYATYAVVEYLDDGRGYTSGIAGFTTATGDAYEVVSRYTDEDPANPLAQYLTTLKALADEESDEVRGLVGYAAAWQRASLDPAFMRMQDDVMEELYYLPAMRKADAVGARTPLSRAFMFDTIIQHGEGVDPDGLDSLLQETAELSGGTPTEGVDETVWLRNFIEVRHADLLDAADATTREVWAESAYRTDVYRRLLDEGDLNLETPIPIKADWIDTILS